MRKSTATILNILLMFLIGAHGNSSWAQDEIPFGIRVEELSEEEKAGQITWLEVDRKLSSGEINRLQGEAVKGRFGGVIFNGIEMDDALLIKKSLDLPARIPLVFGYDCSNGFPRIGDQFDPPNSFVFASISDLKLIRTAGYQFGIAMKEAGMDFIIGPELGDIIPGSGKGSLGGTIEDILRNGEAFVEGLELSGLVYGPNLSGQIKYAEENNSESNPIPNFAVEKGDFISFWSPLGDNIKIGELSIIQKRDRLTLSPTIPRDQSILNLSRNKKLWSSLLKGFSVQRVTEVSKSQQKEIKKFFLSTGQVDKLNSIVADILDLKKKMIQEEESDPTDIYSYSIQSLLTEVRKSSIALVDKGNFLPLDLDGLKIALIDTENIPIQNDLEKYFPVVGIKVIPGKEQAIMVGYDFVIVNHGYGQLDPFEQNFWREKGFVPGSTKFIHIFFGPLGRRKLEFQGSSQPWSLDTRVLIISPDMHKSSLQGVAEIIFGSRSAAGRLAFQLPGIQIGEGSFTPRQNRIGEDVPENHPFDWKKIKKISEVVDEALVDSATPGGQILVLHKGKVIYANNFGHHTYRDDREVEGENLYDLASVTKVAGTMQVIMALDQWGVLNIDDSVVKYLPGLRGTNKEGIIVRDVLVHQAGLQPYIPYWAMIRNREGEEDYFYCTFKDNWFCVPVAESLYTIASIEDSLWQWTLNSELLDKNDEGGYDYRYSDLSFYVLKAIAEKLTGQPIEDFLKQNFWDPMGIWRMAYNPLDKFEKENIIPTEEDKYFRKQLIQGTVHDQGAALLGGVGGHAGMFSNGWELAKIFQMNLNGGSYGGRRYFSKPTIKKFTSQDRQDNRRGLGWDKPNPYGEGPTSDLCSYSTFGHSGFTGTMAWADPDFDLVYVFLSNRTFPDAGNRKLIELNTRTRIQDIIYESIFAHQMKNQ